MFTEKKIALDCNCLLETTTTNSCYLLGALPIMKPTDSAAFEPRALAKQKKMEKWPVRFFSWVWESNVAEMLF